MGNTPDLSEFFQFSQPKKRPCAVAFLRDQLPDDQRPAFEAALATDQGIITNAAIRKWLDVRGKTVTDAAVSVHRKGTCACGRS